MAYLLVPQFNEPTGFDMPPGRLTDSLEFADPEGVSWKARLANTDKTKCGYPLRADTLPSRVTIRGAGAELPDVIAHFVVSGRFRDLVEAFEPGVHQFVAVDMNTPGKADPLAQYFWFIVCQRLGAVDEEHTTLEAGTDQKGGRYWKRARSDQQLVFSNRKIGDHHIWMAPELLSPNCGFCSAAFGEAVIQAGFTGVDLFPVACV